MLRLSSYCGGRSFASTQLIKLCILPNCSCTSSSNGLDARLFNEVKMFVLTGSVVIGAPQCRGRWHLGYNVGPVSCLACCLTNSPGVPTQTHRRGYSQHHSFATGFDGDRRSIRLCRSSAEDARPLCVQLPVQEGGPGRSGIDHVFLREILRARLFEVRSAEEAGIYRIAALVFSL